MRDEILAERLKRSPEQGMKQLIDKYGGTVRALVKGRLMPQSFSEADIDECTADTFSDFYLSLDRCDLSKGSIKAYLCVIARNKAMDRLDKFVTSIRRGN
jgi:RNA polymerase sigma-70 factor (ECF subfamily)